MIRSIPNKARLENNIGSIRSIFYLPKEYVDSFSLSTQDGVTTNDITGAVINTATAWYQVEFVKQTAKFSTEDATGPNGPYEKIKISFKVAKHYAFRVPDFADMREREFMVVMTDNNGTARAIGEINLQGEKRGMRFFKEQTSGETLPQRNEYSCFFYTECDLPALPAFYDQTTPIEPPQYDGGGIDPDGVG